MAETEKPEKPKSTIHAGVHRLVPCALASVGVDVHLMDHRVMFAADIAIFWLVHRILRDWHDEVIDLISGAIFGFFFLDSAWAAALCAPAAVLAGWIVLGLTQKKDN